MSVAVGALDGIKYGFRLLGYFLGVAIVGGVIAAIGAGIVGSSTGGYYGGGNVGGMLLGLLVTVVGVATVYAGILGTGYKVIADGVYRGNLAAEHDGAPPGQSNQQPPPQQPQQGGRPNRGGQ